MHTARPACHHSDQVKDEFQHSLASLPHTRAPSVHGSVQIEEAVPSPPCCADDELASPASSSILVAADAQPTLTIRIDSHEMAVTTTAVTTPKQRRLFCPGDGDGDASPGHTTGSTDDRVGFSGIPSSADVLNPSLRNPRSLDGLPNEILLHVLGFLDVSDVLATSRTNRVLRDVSRAPILHHYRLQRTREVLPPLLWSPARPTVADLMTRSIIRTHTSVISRRLARSLVSIRLSRSLASRPPVEDLVERCVLPKECVPGLSSVHISPGLVAKRKAIEKEKVKDGLRRWIGGTWMGEVRQRERELGRWYEIRGVGRVWKLTRFWEQMSRRDEALPRSLRSRNEG
ncbi:hypothetical protein E4U42_003203 [Claviceps africana]|uniref:F-box domain-containing protein n=1 Tax=Claviceps africana TaxID=83212 RepID=A0A8K0NPB3_9HYPO|nr:hypothetical protein E4U42_003203 [Claviceps africana]